MVYEESCCEENPVDGLAALPISDILRRVDEVFNDYDKLDGRNSDGLTLYCPLLLGHQRKQRVGILGQRKSHQNFAVCILINPRG